MPNYITEISPDNNAHVYQIKDKEAAPITLLNDTVGWVGKNKLKIPASVQTKVVRGITFTVTRDSDGNVIEIDADGTNDGTDASRFYLQDTDGSGNYPISNKPLIASGVSGGSSSTYFMAIWGCNASTGNPSESHDFFDGDQAIGAYPYYKFYIVVKTSQTVNHVKFYPMLRDASITDSTFEPYHKSVEQTLRDAEVIEGKNKANCIMPTKTQLGITATKGMTSNGGVKYTLSGADTGSSGTQFLLVDEADLLAYLKQHEGEKFYISGCPAGGNTTNGYFLSMYLNFDGTIVSCSDIGNGAEIIVPSPVTSARLAITVRHNATFSANTIFYPMLCTEEEWNKSHDYEPYYIPLKDRTDQLYANEVTTGVRNWFNYKDFVFDSATTHSVLDSGRIIEVFSASNGEYRNAQWGVDVDANKDYKIRCYASITSGKACIKVQTTSGTQIALTSAYSTSGVIELSFNSGNNTRVVICLFATYSTSEAGDVIYNDFVVRLADDAMTNRELTEAVKSIQTVGTIVANSSLNDYYKTGDYYSNTGSNTATLSDKPSDLAGAFRLSVICGNYPLGEGVNDVNVPVTQKIELVNGATPAIYMRQKNGGTGTYGSWYKFTGTVVS